MPAPAPSPGDHHRNERAAALVLAITIVTMVLELAVGWQAQSMALIADGWHMGTHAAAMGVTLLAYRYARRHQASGRYSFGAGKAIDLGGFANAVMLAVVALFLALESAERLLSPTPIDFRPALTVAAIGLGVNVLSAWLLRDRHDHPHDAHGHAHHHHDHNREAAFLHVLADAVTSALALGALFGAARYGLTWLDPLVGLIGAALILRWALSLARRTSAVLLDAAPDDVVLARVRSLVTDAGGALDDLRAWPVAAGRFALALRLEGAAPPSLTEALLAVPGIVHVTIESAPRDGRPAAAERRLDPIERAALPQPE